MFAQRLYELDRSSPRYPEQLNELLQDEEWVEQLRSLSEDGLVDLIDYLDSVSFISTPIKSCSSSPQILDGLDRTSPPFRESLHVMREIYSPWAILPTTYGMPGKLSLSATELVDEAGFSDIYKKSFDGADFCIKRLRIYTKDDPTMIKWVSSPHNLWPYRHALTSSGGTLQRGCDVEVPRSPEHRALQRCHP